MKLSKRTLEELRNIINGDNTADYRSGPKLVDFFNSSLQLLSRLPIAPSQGLQGFEQSA